jgi:hypothetical protein
MKRSFLIVAFTFGAIAARAQRLEQSWLQRYNGAADDEDIPVAIAVDFNGDVIVTGSSMIQGDNPDRVYLTIKYSNAGMGLWTNLYAGPAPYANPTALAVDKTGRVFVTGVSHAGSVNQNYATVAYSPTGVPLWTNIYDGPVGGIGGDDVPQTLGVDKNGDVWVTGYSWSSSAYVYTTVKYSNSGTPLWTNSFGGPDNYINARSALAFDSQGNGFLTTASIGTNGYNDYLTVKYSPGGTPVWTNRYNGPGDYTDRPAGIAVDASGKVFVTGISYGNGTGFDFATIAYSNNGVPLWTNRYDGTGNNWDGARVIAVDGNGNVLVSGYSALPLNSGTPDWYATLAYSNSGLPLWTNYYNALGDSEAMAMAIDNANNVFVTGYSVNAGTSSDFATVQYSSTGIPLQTNLFDGGNGPDAATAIAVDQNRNVFVTGYVRTPNGHVDFVTIKYSVVQPPPLDISRSGGNVILSWTNSAFALQSFPTITGTFTNIVGATSPYTNSIDGPHRYFRLISN